MQYGLIGEHLPHSFSKDIHERLGRYPYDLCELAPDALPAFFAARDFRAVNVTIPYKEAVIPALDEVDPAAAAIGAVNTIVNRDGRLCGYNTDFAGMRALIAHMGLDLGGKKVLILGTGGTSKTALAVAQSLGAGCVLRASRTGREGAITYDEARAAHADAAIIINTTPAGMFPHVDTAAVDLVDFPGTQGVVDVVYNPLRTVLVRQAQSRGIIAEGGLYMLVAQAVYAAEHFLGEALDVAALTERIFAEVLREKEAAEAAAAGEAAGEAAGVRGAADAACTGEATGAASAPEAAAAGSAACTASAACAADAESAASAIGADAAER